MKDIKLEENKYYAKSKPIVTICTPIYNRKHTIERTLESVRKQTFRDFEYILVDDGSTDGVESVIHEFMENEKIPVLFIQKMARGGVHTARNLATKYARGQYLINIDSDDELLPQALEVFVEAWNKIPKEDRENYRDVVALCVDQNNKIVGDTFPENINEVDMKTAHKMCYETRGEHVGMDNTQIRKEYLFPEPKGVRFVEEDILWKKLDEKYKTYYVNEPVRVYHTEGNDHLTTKKKKKKQDIINMLYANSCYLRDNKVYLHSFRQYIKVISKYLVSKNIIKKYNIKVYFDYKMKNFPISIKIYIILLYLPCLFLTEIYKKKNCDLEDIKN